MSPACAARTSAHGPVASPPSFGSAGAWRGPGAVGVAPPATMRSSPADVPGARWRGGAAGPGRVAGAACRRGTGSPATASAAAAVGPASGAPGPAVGRPGVGTAVSPGEGTPGRMVEGGPFGGAAGAAGREMGPEIGLDVGPGTAGPAP